MAILASLVAIVAGSALMWMPADGVITMEIRVAGSVLLIAGVLALLLSLFFNSGADWRGFSGRRPRS